MSKRQNIQRLPSDAVQGEGSYVVVRRLTFGEVLDAAAAAKDAATDDLENSLGLIRDHVTEWDWVGDDGQPLPLPTKDPEVVRLLTVDEVAFLATAIRGDLPKAEAKNSVPAS